jgi:5-methylcytosine-specific restriction endonuclease McrA
MANPRRSNGSRRDKLRKRVADEGLPCHLCGKPIDYSLPAGHPMSYELDEIVPVSKGGSPFDRDNVAPAHRICNQKRGNRIDVAGSDVIEVPGAGCSLLSMPLPTSQDW